MKRKANCTNGSVAVSPVGEYFNTPLQEDLPEGWESLKLRDITERITKGSTPTSYGYVYQSEGIKFIKAENIDENGYVTSINDFIDEETNEFLKRSILKVNDVLFSIAGTIGRVGIVRRVDLPANTNQALAIIRTVPGSIDTKYLYYYLKSSEVQKFASKLTVGVGRANLSLTNVSEIEIPIALPDQQKLIVAEIEKQFSRLAEAVAALKRIQANLKRYKASVLKAAVGGKLTEKWRKEHPVIKPASNLLKSILAERKKKWEEKHPGKKYKEPVAPDTSNLPELPEGWVWAIVEQINNANCPCAYGVLQPGPDVDKGVPLVRVGDINNGRIEISMLKKINTKIADNYPRTCLHGGEVLITLVGAIGRTAVVPKSLAGANTARAVGVIPLTDLVNSQWVELWFRNPAKIVEMASKAHEVARKTLNLEDVRVATIALPPKTEQGVIVAEVESFLSVAEEIEEAIKINLKRAERLRQAILKNAFSGRLITYDSNKKGPSCFEQKIIWENRYA